MALRYFSSDIVLFETMHWIKTDDLAKISARNGSAILPFLCVLRRKISRMAAAMSSTAIDAATMIYNWYSSKNPDDGALTIDPLSASIQPAVSFSAILYQTPDSSRSGKKSPFFAFNRTAAAVFAEE